MFLMGDKTNKYKLACPLTGKCFYYDFFQVYQQFFKRSSKI